MDEETVNLILDLQIEDLQSLVSRRKGKGREGSAPTDEELAVELQQNELQNQQTVLADNRMARSVSRAVQDDGAAIVILGAEERRSTRDHEMALSLSGRPSHATFEIPNRRVDEDFLSKFSSLNTYPEDDATSCYSESVVSFAGPEAGESSSWAAAQKTGKSKTKHECVACSEVRPTVETPCQHHYCRICLSRLATDAIVDESLFPPRCCGQTMPISLIRPFIGDGLTTKIEQKAIEFGTLYRTYCVVCGLFINPDDVEGSRGLCLACGRNTCILCKKTFHDGDCPKDTALEDVLRLAQEIGWKRCFGCQALVERREGCNHMT